VSAESAEAGDLGVHIREQAPDARRCRGREDGRKEVLSVKWRQAAIKRRGALALRNADHEVIRAVG